MVNDFLMLSRLEIIGNLIMYFSLVIFISHSLFHTHSHLVTRTQSRTSSLMHRGCVGGFSKELPKRQQR